MDKRGPKSKNPEPRNQGNDEKKSKKGLRLLARVKPSEIFLKSITKDVTNVQITYPCRFVEDLDLSRRRLYGFYLVVAKTVFLGFKEWQRNRALSAFRKNTEHFVRNQFLMLLLVHPQVTFLNGIMCWKGVKEHLLQVDITMERSSSLLSIPTNLLESP
ncbi:hypothetical protein E1A91_D05G341900v1 [Gossypium mustelinum]|uniref:Uncharacterized protein n=1 Tax=Gossypium mustelinum TaxID=34275 RepID=A0A5D2U710_GOSMU|nr:hypothetical protein E1A91_D07G056100v1 [Gossypium mustelinum]TYI72358.1 hypothetical protein E1A91_D07G056100v1 [Gossypium mustelinum]TYI84116.1 hypothetical protein E1A91_D05G341900v1 [Gossypium mustelinum]TYI84119.1 hypothetical protein E1A91_D05G341900v1 [Gossypium mustelinum]